MLLCCVVSRDAWSKRYFDSIRREHSILITCQSNARNMKRSGGKIFPESKRWCSFPILPFRLQKLAPAWPDVLNNTSVFCAWDHIVGTSKLFWYIYRLNVYIVSTYVHTRTLHECSLALAALRAAALARSLIWCWHGQEASVKIWMISFFWSWS